MSARPCGPAEKREISNEARIDVPRPSCVDASISGAVRDRLSRPFQIRAVVGGRVSGDCSFAPRPPSCRERQGKKTECQAASPRETSRDVRTASRRRVHQGHPLSHLCRRIFANFATSSARTGEHAFPRWNRRFRLDLAIPPPLISRSISHVRQLRHQSRTFAVRPASGPSEALQVARARQPGKKDGRLPTSNRHNRRQATNQAHFSKSKRQPRQAAARLAFCSPRDQKASKKSINLIVCVRRADSLPFFRRTPVKSEAGTSQRRRGSL